MNNYRYFEFLAACERDGIPPSLWAKRNGLGNSMPSYLKNGTRPNVETLKKLTQSWNSPESGLRILIAHLKDEVESSGFSLDSVSITTSKNKPAAAISTLDDDLKTVQRFINNRPIRESMHALAELLRAAEDNPEAAKLMAEAENAALLQRMRKKRKKQAS